MIIAKLQGGLGNQMFQYALGRKLSLLRNTALKLNTAALVDTADIDTKRNYELTVFGIDIVATSDDLKAYHAIQNNSFKRRLYKTAPWLFSNHIIIEPSHAYDSEILKSPDNSLLIGFWQTEKYFADIKETLIADFTFLQSLIGDNKEIAEKINSCNSVSLHIRRGDYVSNPVTQEYHGICSMDYYKGAVDQLMSKYKDLTLFIFSDDIDWVKQNLQFNLPVNYISGNNGDKSYIDMQLMSMCKHNIIANSSFSWWGAWLNQNKNKTVIAPKQWFKNSSVDTKDVIPLSWVKI